MQNRSQRIAGLVFGALIGAAAWPWQGWAQTTLKGGVSQTEYTDDYAKNCEKQNANNPYTGMDPLTCYGVMAPVDSRGQCSLAGMQVWKQLGSACYYCQAINPPIQGFIVPLDDVAAAEQQGFRCGADQADACMAVCMGGGSFRPPPGTVETGGMPQTPGAQPPPNPPAYTAPQPNPPLSGEVGTGSNPCLPFGPGGYDYCANPTQPPGCVCSKAPVQQGSPAANPPSQQVPNFDSQLLADAQTLLQNAGRISKAMTDAMDVTKHNNVGIGIAFGAAFGAAGKMMGVAAQQYQALAAAGKAVAQESSVLEIAGDAASESGTMANQATQTASELESEGGGSAMGAPANPAGYQEGMVLEPASAQPPVNQGALPTCTVLSCNRLAQLLGRNTSIVQVFERIQPKIKLIPAPKGGTTVSGGLNAQELAGALQNIGINAQVGTGVPNMMSEVAAGNPVIAGVYVTLADGSPLHAVVIEAAETRAGVAGLRIYDPLGYAYWQPLATFSKYFTDEFVKAL
jgi:hypothetical protein